MATALDRILDYKKDEVAELKAKYSLQQLATAAQSASPTRGFEKRIQTVISAGKNALICEIKRKSPSAGDINKITDPTGIAKSYEAGGGACISVLTDGPSFGGSRQDLTDVRAAVSLPVLRKDFMISTEQVLEARAMGADAILIIMAAVDDVLAEELHAVADEYDMSVLVESHNAEELERALRLPSSLMGVNNRDLKRMVTELSTTEDLSAMIPDDRVIISESGIHSTDDIIRLRRCGANSYLIGESLMRSVDVEQNVRNFVNAV